MGEACERKQHAQTLTFNRPFLGGCTIKGRNGKCAESGDWLVTVHTSSHDTTAAFPLGGGDFELYREKGSRVFLPLKGETVKHDVLVPKG